MKRPGTGTPNNNRCWHLFKKLWPPRWIWIRLRGFLKIGIVIQYVREVYDDTDAVAVYGETSATVVHRGCWKIFVWAVPCLCSATISSPSKFSLESKDLGIQRHRNQILTLVWNPHWSQWYISLNLYVPILVRYLFERPRCNKNYPCLFFRVHLVKNFTRWASSFLVAVNPFSDCFSTRMQSEIFGRDVEQIKSKSTVT